jgi:hypothetical protein
MVSAEVEFIRTYRVGLTIDAGLRSADDVDFVWGESRRQEQSLRRIARGTLAESKRVRASRSTYVTDRVVGRKPGACGDADERTASGHIH